MYYTYMTGSTKLPTRTAAWCLALAYHVFLCLGPLRIGSRIAKKLTIATSTSGLGPGRFSKLRASLRRCNLCSHSPLPWRRTLPYQGRCSMVNSRERPVCQTATTTAHGIHSMQKKNPRLSHRVPPARLEMSLFTRLVWPASSLGGASSGRAY